MSSLIFKGSQEIYNYTLVYPLGSKAAGFLKATLYHQNVMVDKLVPGKVKGKQHSLMSQSRRREEYICACVAGNIL